MENLTRKHLWINYLKKWTPVVLWGWCILFFSTSHFSSTNTSQILTPLLSWLDPNISAEQIEAIHLIIRKLGHWSEYFVFGALTLRALRNEVIGTWERRHLGFALLVVFVYASSDEFHQSLVPSRTAAFGDVMIDLFGGICGALWMYARHGRKTGDQKPEVAARQVF